MAWLDESDGKAVTVFDNFTVVWPSKNDIRFIFALLMIN